MNSQGRKPLDNDATYARALEGRNCLRVRLSPLRGFGVPVSEVQGLAPLAIDCRPYRGLTNSCGINYGVCEGEAYVHWPQTLPACVSASSQAGLPGLTR